MSLRVISNKQLQEVENIIINGYRNIDTRHLESHLYAMLIANKNYGFRKIAETLIGRIHHYLLTADEPAVHLDYKKGIDDLKYWSLQLYNNLVLHDAEELKTISGLLRKLLLDIHNNEEKV